MSHLYIRKQIVWLKYGVKSVFEFALTTVMLCPYASEKADIQISISSAVQLCIFGLFCQIRKIQPKICMVGSSRTLQ